MLESDEIAGARELLEDNAGGPVDTGELLLELGGERRAAVMSDKSCRLVEITTCWQKNRDGTVGPQVVRAPRTQLPYQLAPAGGFTYQTRLLCTDTSDTSKWAGCLQPVVQVDQISLANGY